MDDGLSNVERELAIERDRRARAETALREIEHKAGVLYAALPEGDGERYSVSPYARTAWQIIDLARAALIVSNSEGEQE